jgi:hypothetical protein
LHLLGIDHQCAPPHGLAPFARALQGIDASEKSGDPGGQVRQAHVLGQEIVRPQPEPRHRIQFAVSRRQKNDRQLRRKMAQVAAQIETALCLVFQRDVDDGEVRQPDLESLHGGLAVGVGLHLIAVPCERRGVILAKGRLILDDGDVLLHALDDSRRAATIRQN